MRSDRDERTETEREIDDFLSKFDPPADELSADIGSYLNEQNEAAKAPAQTFSWKNVDSTIIRTVNKESSEGSGTAGEHNKKEIIVNNNSPKDEASTPVVNNKQDKEKNKLV